MAVIPDRGVKVAKCFGIFPVFFGKCIAFIDNDAYRYAIRLGCGKKTVDKVVEVGGVLTVTISKAWSMLAAMI